MLLVLCQCYVSVYERDRAHIIQCSYFYNAWHTDSNSSIQHNSNSWAHMYVNYGYAINLICQFCVFSYFAVLKMFDDVLELMSTHTDKHRKRKRKKVREDTHTHTHTRSERQTSRYKGRCERDRANEKAEKDEDSDNSIKCERITLHAIPTSSRF